MSKNILLLDGNTRQVLPVAKAINKLGHNVTVLTPAKFSVGYVSKWVHNRVVAPDPKVDPNGFLKGLLRELRKKKYDLVIPLFDYSAEIVSKHKEELERYTRLAVNQFDIFNKARNKAKTIEICMENAIPCTNNFYVGTGSVPNNLGNLKYPVVIKPVFGESARGFFRVKDDEELKRLFPKVSEEFGETMIQQYIPQNDIQYKCEVYISKKQEVKAAVVFSKNRWYPIDGGSSTFNITVERPDIIKTCTKLLLTMGWIGYADVDLIQDPRTGEAKIMEINPRITGSVKIAFEAGVDFAELIINDNLDEEVPNFSYNRGVGLRLLHKDILWLLKSKERFKTKPNWFNFSKSSDQIISFSDPLPTLIFSLEGVIKLFKGR